MNEPGLVRLQEPAERALWYDTEAPRFQSGDPSSKRLVDLAWIRGVLFRQRWILAASPVVAIALGLIATLLMTPIYEASTTVRVNLNPERIVEGQSLQRAVEGNQIRPYLVTQQKVLTSRSFAILVARELNFGERRGVLDADFDESRPSNVSDEKWAETRINAAAGVLQGNVAVDIPYDHSIITIKYQSPSASLAAEVANGYADLFAQEDTRSTIQSNIYAQQYLLGEIAQVREKLRIAERAVNDYVRNAGLVAPGTVNASTEEGEGKLTINGANLASINKTFAEARARRIAAEQRWLSVSNLEPTQISEVQQNPGVQALVTERSKAESDLFLLRQRYDDNYPPIKDGRDRIVALERQIRELGQSVKANLRNEFVIARNQEEALQRELMAVTENTLDEQDDLAQLSILERDAQVLRDQLGTLLARATGLQSASNVESEKISKLDAALVPGSPVSPKLGLNIFIALAFSLAVAVAIAIVREFLDDRLRSVEDVEQHLGVPVLGITPYLEDSEESRNKGEGFNHLMEAYASIRTSIDFSVSREEKVIQLTSSRASEGKSTSAVLVAELFAALGRKVLLIDSDMRRPSIHLLRDIKGKDHGLAAVVLGHVPFEDAVVRGVSENLDILTVGQRPPNPVELLASKQMRDLIDAKRSEYSLIIIDSPPVVGLADAPTISRLADATVFILEANSTNRREARAALDRLQAVGAHTIGVVLTKFRAQEAGAGYGYSYDYYQYGQA